MKGAQKPQLVGFCSLTEDFLEAKNKGVQIQDYVIQIVSAVMGQGERGWGTG